MKASKIDMYLYIRVNNHFSFTPLGRVNAENTSFTNLVHVLHQLLVDYQISDRLPLFENVQLL